MSWKKKFEKLADEVRAHPDLVLETFELRSPAKKAELQAAAAFLGRPLPAEVASFYREMNGLELAWHHLKTGACGLVRVGEIATVFRPDWAEDAHGNKPWLPFDWAGDEHYAGFDAESGELFWVEDVSNEGAPLGCSFTEYLEAALAHRATQSWQPRFLEGVLDCALPEVDNTPETVLVFRPGELPSVLTRELPEDAGPRECLFYVAASGSPAIDALFDALPEPDVDHVKEGMRVAESAGQIASAVSGLYRTLYPQEEGPLGNRTSGGVRVGFHTAPAAESEKVLKAAGAKLVRLSDVLDDVQLLEVRDVEGQPVNDLQYRRHNIKVQSFEVKMLQPGLFALDRAMKEDLERFVVFSGDAERELALAELPAGLFELQLPG